jgi:adenylate cyclase
MDPLKSGFGPAAVREQLRRILASADFDAPKRNRLFLEYVVGETLEGRADRVKAYTIATSVFGRDAGFDPQLDSIVRIEAGRLRRSLERYYLTAGAKEPIRIAIPKGSYVPEFAAAQPAQSAAAPPFPAPAVRRTQSCQHGRVIFVRQFEEDGDQSAFPNFTRGFTRQVIVGLTRFTDLFVLGPETTDRYGEAADMGRLREDLGIDYLLTGGTRVSADGFSVEALLIDARTGRNLWADSFERTLQAREVFRVRDEVANCVARTLAQPYGIIFSDIVREADETLPDNLVSYDWVIRFYQYWRTYDRVLFEPVRAGLEQAIVKDPRYAEAFACLSQMYSNAFRFKHHVSGITADPLQRAFVLARRAIDLAPNGSRGHHALSLACWFAGDTRGAIAALETSHALNPNDTEIMADLGLRYAMQTDWDKAVPLLEESFARNPAEPSTYRAGLFLYHYAGGRYEKALTEARRIEAPGIVYGFVAVAAAAAQLGLQREAGVAVKSILMIDPHYGDHVVSDLSSRNLHPDLVRTVVEGLRKAGLAGTETEPSGDPVPAARVV